MRCPTGWTRRSRKARCISTQVEKVGAEEYWSLTQNHMYFIDANSGSVVWHYDAMPSDADGKSQYSGLVHFPTVQPSLYRMQDPMRGAGQSNGNQGDFTADLRNQTGCSGILENCMETD